MSDKLIYQVEGYATCRDYELLADLMQKGSVVCLVDYKGMADRYRDVARTIFNPASVLSWQMSVRGMTYVMASSRKEFIEQCQQLNVEVVLPKQDLAAPTVAEAVKGLCAAKVELIKRRDSLREQGMWIRFDAICNQYTKELAAIDERLDALTQLRYIPSQTGPEAGARVNRQS